MRLRVGIAAACLGLMGVAMPADDTMPPNTILASAMMRELSAQPGFTETFLKEVQGGPQQTGPALLTPSLVDHLRELMVGKNWQGLDRFPGWTMAAITPAVGAISHLVTSPSATEMEKFLDVGPYGLDTDDQVVDLGSPSPLPDFAADNPITDLGYGMTRPDGPNELAPEHPDSARLAYVLNRLAANGLDGVRRFAVETPWVSMERHGIALPQGFGTDGAHAVTNMIASRTTAEDLIADLIRTGHTVTITDHRAIANFAQLHYHGQDVMMPFFLNSEIVVPGTKRPLLVPALHAEYQFHVHGPMVNADVAFYFAIDGKAQFRTMDEKDEAWVMGRDAHVYTGRDAVEVTRLAGAVVRKYMRLHQAYPDTPFHGYYAFGVCQDVVAAIELKMTGKTTLFPNTADERYFTGPDTDWRDGEIDQLIMLLPKDRGGKPPQVERIFGSLPVGSSDKELATITIPGLAPDLIAVHDAWTQGKLNRTPWNWKLIAALGAVVLLALLRAIFGLRHALEPRR